MIETAIFLMDSDKDYEFVKKVLEQGLKMIKEGQFTIIDGKTYQVVRIDESFAYLHNVETYKGRPRKMLLSRVPYFDEEGTLIEPKQEETKIPTRKFQSKVNVRRLLRAKLKCRFQRRQLCFFRSNLVAFVKF